MSHPVRTARWRAGIAAGGLVLALSLASSPVVLAQDDDPTTTITNLAAAMEARQYDLLPTFFCPEQAAQAAMFDPSVLVASLALALPEGVDTSSLGEAFSYVPSIESLEVVSQSDTEAVVTLVGTLAVDVDTTALAPFVEAMLAAQGMEVTPDMAEMMTSMLVGQFAMDPIDISDELTLVPGETMPWVLCDAFGAGTEPSVDSSAEPVVAMPSAEASAAPA